MHTDNRTLVMTLASSIQPRRRRADPELWGPWVLDTTWLTLTHGTSGYEVDLETCTSPAKVLDWIMQIAGKTWGDAVTVAGVAQALNALLEPQAYLCPSGRSRRLSPQRIRQLVTEH